MSVGSITAVGFLGSTVPGAGAPRAKHQDSRTDAGTQALLARAEQEESQIRSGRLLLTRTTEYHSLSDRELRELIKDPKQLQVELAIAKVILRRIAERETIRFDNRASRLLTESVREGGQVAASRALFTPAFHKTFAENRVAPVEERQEVFINRPIWPPYSPYDRWRGRCWSGRIEAIRKGQIVAHRREREPRTGQIVLILAGGPGAQLDQKLWIDPARGYTIPRLQCFDTKSHRLEIDERAHYRHTGGLWYPDRLITTYYQYNAQGRQALSRRESSVVTEARLNVALTEAAFAFPVPHGACVQDDRVNPPLVYREGVTPPQPQQRQQAPPRQPLVIGQPAPEFELPSLSGEKIKLADLRGRVVVLNLFALWCAPCNAEAPHLETAIWQRYKDQGVVVLGMHVWHQKDPVREAREFAKKHQLTYPVVVDATGQAAKHYALEAVPTNLVIGKNGAIRYLHVDFDEDELRQAIDAALKE